MRRRPAATGSQTQDTSDWSRQCSATEPRQPDNHQPSQSSICTAQVVLNASVAHLAATQYVPSVMPWMVPPQKCSHTWSPLPQMVQKHAWCLVRVSRLTSRLKNEAVNAVSLRLDFQCELTIIGSYGLQWQCPSATPAVSLCR